ncbi:Structure-specific endonuclease subunit SLX4 [Seiridium cupressi]
MSSPARASRYDTYTVRSSSPDLPSLGEIFNKSPKKAPPLRSGSNAAAIPTAARSTFTSAADILREAPEIDIETEQVTLSPPQKAKPARKPRAKAKQATDAPELANMPAEVALSPKRFKSTSKKSASESSSGGATVQPILPKSRVTKAPATGKTRTRVKKQQTETVSKHFAAAEEKEPENKTSADQPPPGDPSRPPQPALARRIDWTPPRANSTTVILDSESDNRELLSSVERAVVPKEVFQNLFDDFAHKSKQPDVGATAEVPEKVSEVMKKRKRLDFASVSDDKRDEKAAQSKKASPTKAPAAKKKTRTITELATAPYAIPEIPDVDLLAPGNKDALLKYFDTDGHVKALVEHQSVVIDRNNDKPKKKPAKTRRKKQGATVEDPILLSPNSALKQSTSQDFVFGTSSQLVLEESPRTLRNLQAAIQASMQEDDPFASSPTTPKGKQKGLWHAGARDTDGDLLEAETMDLMDDNSATTNAQEVSEVNVPDQVEFPDIGDSPANTLQTASGSTDPKSHFWLSQRQASSLADTGASSASEPPSSAQLPSSSKTATLASTPRPKYDLFTDAQLAKQITSYGFKPVKRRQAMIALLDQCWASQHPGASTAPSSVGIAASISTSAAQKSPKKRATTKAATAVEAVKKPRGRPKKADQAVAAEEQLISPKRGRGRPRKTSVTDSEGTEVVITKSKVTTPTKRRKSAKQGAEIADSENDNSLSSPQSLAESVFSSPPPIDLSISDEGETSLNLTPTEQEAVLFTHITKAVMSAPRSKDPNEPSWHEKMLLYDPVVLEDLAAWLNAGQLTRVGYDGEVAPAEVKTWCESKSVICLWKANTRGKERKRY